MNKCLRLVRIAFSKNPKKRSDFMGIKIILRIDVVNVTHVNFDHLNSNFLS